MTWRQNSTENFLHLRLVANRGHDRFRRSKRAIDFHALGNRPARLRKIFVELLRKLHCPGNICRAAVKLAINEIGAPSKEKTDWRGHDQVVAQVGPGEFVPPRIIKREREKTKHSAVARHSAFPHAKDRKRFAQHLRFVEKNEAQSSSDNDAEERSAGDEIADFGDRQVGITAPCQNAINKIAANKREHVSESVPARTNIVPEPEDQRIKIVNVISEHLCGAILNPRSRGSTLFAKKARSGSFYFSQPAPAFQRPRLSHHPRRLPVQDRQRNRLRR